MTEHKATLGQWSADRYDWARADTEAMDGNSAFRCIMELRSRVEALEASDTNRSDHIGEVNKMVPDGSLVERVAYAITGDDDEPINWKPEARAVIRVVAAWLRERGWEMGARGLEREAGR
jgi:hypothetical protein